MRGCSYHAGGSFPDTCEACRLESRIDAMAAELESARAYAVSCSVNSQNDSARREEAESEVARLREELVKWQLAFGFIEADEALDDCATKLATERAAREKAEAERAESQRQANDWYQAHLKLCAIGAQLKQSERERDEQLKVFEALEKASLQYASERDTARIELKETLAALEKANENFVNQHRDCVMPLMNERDTALARVKELEPWEKRYDKLNAQYEAQAEQLEKEYDRRVAAETALASARDLLEDAWDERHAMKTSWCNRYRAWLTSHPSPSPAPCAGCERVRAVVARLSNAAGDVYAGFIVSKLQEALDDAPDPAQAPSNPRGTGPVPMLLGDDPAEASRRETGDW